jgi:hypothetical protein
MPSLLSQIVRQKGPIPPHSGQRKTPLKTEQLAGSFEGRLRRNFRLQFGERIAR